MGDTNLHAVLSPSGASRWLACTPSARLEQQFPDSSGDAAREGTLAHSIGELMLRHATGALTNGQYETMLYKLQQSDLILKDNTFVQEFYCPAMKEYCEQYCTFVMEQLSEARNTTPDAQLHIEKRLDLTEFVPEGFGTGDAAIVTDNTMHVIDLKYGKGVEVSAIDNSQMKIYALGWRAEFSMEYEITSIKVTIFQPRIDNYSTWEISVSDLLQWATEVLQPRAKLAFAGEGDYTPGKHCGFCRAKAQCKALARHCIELAEHRFTEAVQMSDDDIAQVLTNAKLFTDWLKAVTTYALTEAVKGKKWPGYKIVEGRSIRVLADELKAVAALRGAGFSTDDYYTQKMVGITALEALLGKKEFKTLLGPLTTKPPGSPTLAIESDKRAEFSPTASAMKAFAAMQEDEQE
jgi:hypothetical protein